MTLATVLILIDTSIKLLTNVDLYKPVLILNTIKVITLVQNVLQTVLHVKLVCMILVVFAKHV